MPTFSSTRPLRAGELVAQPLVSRISPKALPFFSVCTFPKTLANRRPRGGVTPRSSPRANPASTLTRPSTCRSRSNGPTTPTTSVPQLETFTSGCRRLLTLPEDATSNVARGTYRDSKILALESSLISYSFLQVHHRCTYLDRRPRCFHHLEAQLCQPGIRQRVCLGPGRRRGRFGSPLRLDFRGF
jgi:hypothetical protein